MRRYTILLITSFILILSVFSATLYLSSTTPGIKHKKLRGEISVYTTLPVELVTHLAEAYENEEAVRVNFIPLGRDEIEKRLVDNKVDMLLADSRTLDRAAGRGYLVPYTSEYGDGVAANFRHEKDFWIGVWYDPVVFSVNRDYMQRADNIPLSWHDLGEAKDIRIGITDFLAAESAAATYFFLVGYFGEDGSIELLKKLHPKVIQYSKYLSTPARMAGMGEVDLAICVQSEALRHIEEGYPLKIIYPLEGSTCSLIGTGMLINPPQGNLARKFADWLLTDEAQLILQRHKFYFVSSNPSSMAYKKIAAKRTGINYWQEEPDLSLERQQELLDRWVKDVRINDI